MSDYMEAWQHETNQGILREALGAAVNNGLRLAESEGASKVKELALTWPEWTGLMAEVRQGLTARSYDEFMLILNGLPVGVIRDCFAKFTAEGMRKNKRPDHAG